MIRDYAFAAFGKGIGTAFRAIKIFYYIDIMNSQVAQINFTQQAYWHTIKNLRKYM